MKFTQPITAALVARLRDEIEEPMLDCKKYLTMFEGDYDAALKYVRETPYHRRRCAKLDGIKCPCCGK